MQLGYKVSKCIITESTKSFNFRDSVMALIPQRFSHNRLYENKWLRSNFLQEYFEDINVIITTSP
jgi:hypothetical protein